MKVIITLYERFKKMTVVEIKPKKKRRVVPRRSELESCRHDSQASAKHLKVAEKEASFGFYKKHCRFICNETLRLKN